jgi:hypothetical protein
MTRPRRKTTQKLPQGLYERKKNGKVVSWIFYRIDNSSKSFRDLKEAKRLAFQYNRTYRVDPELTHGIFKDTGELKTLIKQQSPLGQYLPAMFDRIIIDKKWKDRTLSVRTQQFQKVLEHFKDINCNDLSLHDVNDFLLKYDGSNDASRYNRYLYILKEVLENCVDQGILNENVAAKKKRKMQKAKSSLERTRLNFNDFRRIHALAGEKGNDWLQVAMELAVQTSQGVNEVASMQYKDIEDNHLKVIRKKTEDNEASHVKIPVNDEIKSILSRSRADSVLSPYIVHRARIRRYSCRKLGNGITHETQLPNEKISRRFSELRDELGIQSEIKTRKDRAGFHDIRALSIHWQDINGYDSMVRAAHADEKSNKIYREGHIDWKTADDVTIDWKKAE